MITASDNVLENLLTVELLNMQNNIKDAIKFYGNCDYSNYLSKL